VSVCDDDLSEQSRRFLVSRVRWIFRADEKFDVFWDLCARHEILKECARARAGALVRSGSVFEDVVKTMCTVNCHWRQTKKMSANLCAAFGERCPGDSSQGWGSAFPSAKALASVCAQRLADAGLGFRARFVRGFAQSVDCGDIDLTSWVAVTEPSELRRSVQDVPGIGPYSANHILVLLGHYDFIPCDSDVCAFLGLKQRTQLREAQRIVEERF
jgi:3-methyladenine DNA glycosylase/8-oxoguanine DNA glycosylase